MRRTVANPSCTRSCLGRITRTGTLLDMRVTTTVIGIGGKQVLHDGFSVAEELILDEESG